MQSDISKKENNNKVYICANLLQAGDVILLKGKGLFSNVISYSTKGIYSHAALVVNSLVHFEATQVGLGYTPIKISKVENHPSFNRWLWDVSDYELIDVYRLKDVKNLSIEEQDSQGNKLIEILKELEGLEYPELAKLSNATSILSKYPDIKRKLSELISKNILREQKINQGMFCSQIVSFALQETGNNLLRKEINYDEISPNDLARSETTNLVKLENIKFNEDVNIKNDIELLKQVNIISDCFGSREEYVGRFVEARKIATQMENLIAAVDNIFKV